MTSKKNYTKNSNPSGPTANAGQTITNRGTCSQTPYATPSTRDFHSSRSRLPPATRARDFYEARRAEPVPRHQGELAPPARGGNCAIAGRGQPLLESAFPAPTDPGPPVEPAVWTKSQYI